MQYISKILCLWAAPLIIVPKTPDPLNPQKTKAFLSFILPTLCHPVSELMQHTLTGV